MNLVAAAPKPVAWPDGDTCHALERDARVGVARTAARLIAALAPGLRVCVQAGGHIGLWPRELAEKFARVYTCEPEPANYACLLQNATSERIVPIQGALGDRPGWVSLANHNGKSGMWRVVPGETVPVYTVDAFELPVLDALVLDVEGWELPALRGAERTIARHKPLVWFEAHEHGAKRGGSTTDIIQWVYARGYQPPKRGLGRDLYMQAAA